MDATIPLQGLTFLLRQFTEVVAELKRPYARSPDISTVMLECPACRRRKRVALDAKDPPGTVMIRVLCLKCGEADVVEYFDKDGRPIR